MLSIEDTKRQAAQRSMAYVQDGMRVGLGTGSTAKYVVELLGERVRAGLKIVAVPTSNASYELAKQHGVPLATFAEVGELDVDIDGADEVGPGLGLIKGGGGALLHEKIVAAAAREFIVVVGEGKVVPMLGKFPLPVEVIICRRASGAETGKTWRFTSAAQEEPELRCGTLSDGRGELDF